ncbi:MAG: M13 family metallopeptidase N-terminal domain-containing protein, partial [Gemmatimonadaceae bacterium]
MRSKSAALLAVALAAGAALPLGAQGTYRQTVPLDPVNLDRTANACVDFYQFANGGWLRSNPLPAAFSRWGSFDELGEKNQDALTTVLKSAGAKSASNKSYAMLATYYGTCMDSAAAEKAGAKPLEQPLHGIGEIDSREDLIEEIARLQNNGVPVLFGFGSTQDAKNSTSVIAGAFQGGIGLPDRDYYFNA